MTLLEGRHVSSDVALVDGMPKWWRHATGLATGEGMFDRWTIHAAADPTLEAACGAWIARNLRGFTGILNLETIGGTIIEAHLRLSDQWPDLYGAGWTEAFVGLYRDRAWRYADADRRDGYSIVLCGPWGRRYRHPPPALVQEVAAMPGVSSVQITFHEDKAPERHSMPPGGFRVAIVNAFDLETGGGGTRGAAQTFPGRGARRQHPARPIAYSRAAMHGNHPSLHRRSALALAVAAAANALMPSGAWAQGAPGGLADRLTPAQLAAYEAYRTARDHFERQLKAYWHRVEAKRDARKAKRMLGQEYEAEDYIARSRRSTRGPSLPPTSPRSSPR